MYLVRRELGLEPRVVVADVTEPVGFFGEYNIALSWGVLHLLQPMAVGESISQRLQATSRRRLVHIR
uniref:Uncharacterized protein n=1 Tax=Thermogladius calderae TaxID=1200300 RepID=A0A7J3Y029_9CREN